MNDIYSIIIVFMSLWALGFNNYVEGIEIDIRGPMTNDTAVYTGSFSNGGIYRLIKPLGYVSLIVYGNQVLYNAENMKGARVVGDIYIEDFKRGTQRTIGITICEGIRHYCLRRRYYRVAYDMVHMIRWDLKSYFLKGTVSLDMDLSSEFHHPAINTHEMRTNTLHNKWYVVDTNKFDPSNPSFQMPFYDDSFCISHVYNIEPQLFQQLPASVLIANVSRLVVCHGNGMVLITLDGSPQKVYTVIIPPIINGIFKPRNALEDPRDIANIYTSNGMLHCLIPIDISRTMKHPNDVVILANLHRGDWLYSQFSIYPIRHPGHCSVKVLNMASNSIIYKSPNRQTVVTHVEVFDHIIHKWQYIVVNYIKWNGYRFEEKQDAYKRIEDKTGVYYYDLKKFVLEPYIQLLYNIDTAQSIYKNTAQAV
ncbi:hypothetical protein BBOV_III011300 [Babesia bovis T2Bo]|uniref:6-Cys domain-containing protein n=1 Tax=Babesia bovis TaxID=5865 RepID=A7AQ48_BABBO|nr:hypothetical protein BBOV_III011300 [Babesia bovis T2Bo]EDO08682.1 hypothetical protein BBOV_III011300 [Babesia bovis T2Bo]|eukprot:XP_001612250.1 hypothetical protein [Babesia bovis T2Bo]